MASYTELYVRKNVSVMINDDTNDEKEVVSGYLYYGTRIKDTYMKRDNFYKMVGFRTITDVERDSTVGNSTPSVIKVATADVACRMGIIEELGFALIPLDATLTLYPFNKRYVTSLAVSRALPKQDIIDILYSKIFQLGEESNLVSYKIEPGSIVEKRSKRRNPIFTQSRTFGINPQGILTNETYQSDQSIEILDEDI